MKKKYNDRIREVIKRRAIEKRKVEFYKEDELRNPAEQEPLHPDNV